MKITSSFTSLFVIILITILGCASQTSPTTPTNIIQLQNPSIAIISANRTSTASVTLITSESKEVTIRNKAFDGEWQSIEKASDFGSSSMGNTIMDGKAISPALVDAIIRFIVKEGQIVTLEVNLCPIKYELFAWWIDTPLDIRGDSFQCSQSSLPAENSKEMFTLKGKFTAHNECEGSMIFPKGFYWIDFAMPRDVAVIWTAKRVPGTQ